ncbi:putative DNA- binding protein [Trypoxylus dichotomus]
MSTKSGKRPLRSLTAHEKLDAIRRVHDGESKASVARDIGVPESTLRGWCKNEDKISYLSRQSSPETDDSIHLEPKEKKTKIEDNTPFNLSLKVRASYSPPTSDVTGFNGKAPATTATSIEGEKDTKLSANSVTQETPKSTQMTERERNRAELARLSIELGLNRPEMFNSKSTTGNTLADLSTNIGLLAQWNTLLLQQQQQKPSTKKVTGGEANTFPIPPTPLLAYTAKPDQKGKLPKVDPQKSVEDSVWYWLNQQAMLGLSQTAVANVPTTTANDNPTTTQANGSSYQNSSWFWKWYKQFASTQIVQSPSKPILYQQLTKDKDVNNTENLQNEEKPKNSTKARAVLDNLLLHNNNNVASVNKRECGEEDLTQTEAIEHGEKFLKWLECCGDPSVTAMQIMQLKSLLNNIKTGLDRRNNDHSKTKVKRK